MPPSLRRAETILACTLGGLIWLLLLKLAALDLAPRLLTAFLNGPEPPAPLCGDPQCDVSQFWPAGFAARAGHFLLLYNPNAFLALRQALLPGTGYVPFLYPPTALLPSALISYFPFGTAFLLWSFGYLILAIIALRAARLSWKVIAAGLLSPAGLLSFELGQFGTITGALLAAGLLMAATAPKRAGALLALLILKPPAAFLVPVALLAQRNLPAFLTAALTATALLALTLLCFGWPAWHAYLTEGATQARLLLNAPPFPHSYENNGTSLFWMLRSLGAGLPLATAAQLTGAFLAVLACALTWAHPAPTPTERMALTVILSLFVTPYGFTYDMVGYSLALAAIAQERAWRITLLDTLLWLWPALCRIVTLKTGVLFTPLILLLAIVKVSKTFLFEKKQQKTSAPLRAVLKPPPA